MSETMKKLAAAYAAEVIKNRRYLHAHPELSFHETNTAKGIRPLAFPPCLVLRATARSASSKEHSPVRPSDSAPISML